MLTSTSTPRSVIYPHWGTLLIITPSTPKFAAPSLSLKAKAKIVDTGAEVTITQTFSINTQTSSSDTKTEAIYQFPLPENAAVCKFECECDGRIIRGVAKEKEEAREVYDKAVSAGKTASLLEQHQPDVFQVSVGNLKGKAVITRVTYIQELSHNNESDEIRFYLLSKQLQQRYGQPPEVSVSNSADVSEVVSAPTKETEGPCVEIDVEMASPILSIQSPSHSSVAMNLGSVSGGSNGNNSSNEFNPTRANLHLDQDSGKYLDKEMVVVVKARDLDQPRCMVEPHPTDGTNALSLTLVPRFVLNEIRTEVIILVDRSGSMEGTKITQAINALQLLLKSFPANKGLYFNIVSFGSSHSLLFNQSVEYTAKTLKQAEDHVSRMEADMGGTELQSAVEAIFKLRRRDMPTQLFVLTDGEIWNSEPLFAAIRAEVDKSKKTNSGKSFLRVFSLGIGNDVSHNLVEGMARSGDGFAQFVMGENERLQPKVIKMLKAAVLPPVTDYKIHWTEDWNPASTTLAKSDDDWEKVKPTISLFSSKPAPPPLKDETAQVPRFVQPAPFNVPTLWPGTRFTAYAILDASIPVPKTVNIIGTSPDGPLELVIPVHATQPGITIHTLAARKLIRDLEDQTSFLDVAMPCPEETRKKEIVLLGTQYSLASSHTSFVAVDESDEKDNIIPTMQAQASDKLGRVQQEVDEVLYSMQSNIQGVISRGYQLSALQYQSDDLIAQSARFRTGSRKSARMSLGGFGNILSFFGSGSAKAQAPAPSFTAPPPAPCVAAPPPPPAPVALSSSFSAPAPGSAAKGYSASYALPAKACFDEAPTAECSVEETGNDLFEACCMKGSEKEGVTHANRTYSSTNLSNAVLLQSLVDLQEFDGSFDLVAVNKFVKSWLSSSSDLTKVLAGATGAPSNVNVSAPTVAKAFAAAVAVYALEKKFGGLKDEWEMMANKAKSFAVGVVGSDGWTWLLSQASASLGI